MTRRVMENLYKELEKYGYTFIEQGFRFLDKRYDGNDDFVSYGILRRGDGYAMTPMRLQDILQMARRKKTYMVQVRGKKEVHSSSMAANQSIPLQKNDMVVCFIQQGLLQVMADARKSVAESFRNSFWYCQENEKALALDEAFERLRKELVLFDTLAHDVHSLERNSVHFRRFVKREAVAYMEMDEMMTCIENVAHQRQAESLQMAFVTLYYIC